MNASLSSLRAIRISRPSIVIPVTLLMAALAVAGFWRTYFGPLLLGGPPSGWLVHLHAAVFMGWLALVALQSWLAATGRTALHVRVGRIGMLYGVVVVLLGLGFSLVTFAHRVAVSGPAGAAGGFLVPLVDLGTYSLFLAGAWITRRRPESHKRFILLAANTLIIAAVGRLFGGTASIALRDVIPFLVLWLSPLWIAMTWDAVRHRMVHSVYLFGAAWLILLRYRQLVRETDTWMAVSRWIAERLM
jgi:hypothetical protein